MINHYGILDSVLTNCKVSKESRDSVIDCLEVDRVNSCVNIPSFTRYGVERSVAESLTSFDLKDDIQVVKKRLKESFKSNDTIWTAFKEAEMLVKNLKSLGVKNRVLLMPLLSYHASYYKGSFMFQIGKLGLQKIDVFIAGGIVPRYNCFREVRFIAPKAWARSGF
jgi:histidyl-tRNA synthetase